MTKFKSNGKKISVKLILVIAAAVILIILSAMCTVQVPTGHTGVVVTFGRTESYVLSEGLHFVLPWQNVIKMDNRAQKESITLSAFSSDIQQVEVNVSVNYSVDRETSQELYRNVGQYYYDTVMNPRIMEDVKAVFSKCTAENLVASREDLSTEVESILSPEMKAYGIEIISVSIEDIDFTDVFTDAVEAKQVAEQSKLQAEIEEAQKTMIAQQEAERAQIQANANAEVAKINADAEAYAVKVAAEAEAEANQKIANSLTNELIQYNEVSRWNGELPQVYASDGTVPILNMQEDNNTQG